eukprot:Nk52_evm30s163 gene=Nk52_evmTU30s163
MAATMIMLSMAIMQGISLHDSEKTKPIANYDMNMEMMARSAYNSITYENFSPQSQQTCSLHVSFALTEAFKGNFVYAFFSTGMLPSKSDVTNKNAQKSFQNFYSNYLPTDCWIPDSCDASDMGSKTMHFPNPGFYQPIEGSNPPAYMFPSYGPFCQPSIADEVSSFSLPIVRLPQLAFVPLAVEYENVLEKTGRRKFRSFNWCETIVMRLLVQFNYEAGPGCTAMPTPIQCQSAEWSFANKNMMCNGGPDKEAYTGCLANMNLFAFICRYANTDSYFLYDDEKVLYQGTSHTTKMDDFVSWVVKSTGDGVENDFVVAQKVETAVGGTTPYNIMPIIGTPSKLNSQKLLSEFARNMCKVAITHFRPPALKKTCSVPAQIFEGTSLGP